ncbi:MAG: AarF/UbiB family protein [Acidobacteriota bacterium]
MIRPLLAVKRYRRLRRYRQVTFVLVKYGFDDIVERLGASPFWPGFRRRRKATRVPTPRRLRFALTELGPTFIKFGQLLSTRPDLLPESYIAELSRLQDQVPPFSFPEVERIVAEELHLPVTRLFASFERDPVASGSIAQVHRATLGSGATVAVKIQRPAIPGIIEADLAILEELADLVERHLPELRLFRPRALVDQFARTIRRELDFVAEAQAMECFRRNFENDPTRFVPKVYWELTTPRILVSEFVQGVKLTDLAGLQQKGLDPKIVARNGARNILREVFEFRYFHADPHPGNYFVLDNHVIATVDYGIVGRLDELTSDILADLLAAAVSRDLAGIIRAFRLLGVLHEEMDEKSFRFDVQDFLDRYYGLPLQRLDAERILADLLRIVRRHHIVLPVDLALLGRMLTVAAGVGRILDPDFDILSEAKPYIVRFMSRRASPARKLKDLRRTLRDYEDTLRSLPGDFDAILKKMKQGQMLVSLHHEGLNRFILEMDRSSNRIAFGLIVASLIVASSLVMQHETGPQLFGWPALGLVGYLIAGVLGLWLVIAILRSGRI